MARTWTALYASVCTSKRLARVKKPDSQVFYFLLLTQCDAYGKAEDDAETLCARVWPLLGKSHKQTREAIDDLTQAGLLSKHAQDGATWLQIYAWDTHAGKHKGGNPGRSDYPDSSAANATSPVLPGSPRNSPVLPGGSGGIRGSTLLSSDLLSSPLSEGALDLAAQPLPAHLDRQDVREALAEYQAIRAENKHPALKARGWNQRVRELEKMTPEDAIASLAYSGAHQGFYPKKAGSNGNGKAFQHAFEKTGDAIDQVFGKLKDRERTVDVQVVKPKEIAP